jgi:hypothetical protein
LTEDEQQKRMEQIKRATVRLLLSKEKWKDCYETISKANLEKQNCSNFDGATRTHPRLAL